jgi:type II secretory pathway pseudopilin PulG
MPSSAHDARWIRKEATMAAITLDSALQKQQARKQLETALAAYREMLDTFVSNQMRKAAAEAEQAGPPQLPITSSQPKDSQ